MLQLKLNDLKKLLIDLSSIYISRFDIFTLIKELNLSKLEYMLIDTLLKDIPLNRVQHILLLSDSIIQEMVNNLIKTILNFIETKEL